MFSGLPPSVKSTPRSELSCVLRLGSYCGCLCLSASFLIQKQAESEDDYLPFFHNLKNRHIVLFSLF